MTNKCIDGALMSAAAACAAVALSYSAAADVVLKDVLWEFYQGGYVEDARGNFIVSQNHYGGSLRKNVVSHSLFGTTFTSTATMETELVQSEGFFRFEALNTLTAFAAVDVKLPQGVAHAFAGLSAFVATFMIASDSYLYTGSETLEDDRGNSHESGSVLGPGVYRFFEVNPFPPLVETDFVGPGQSQTVEEQRLLAFQFQAIPAPSAAMALGLAAAWIGAFRRRRDG